MHGLQGRGLELWVWRRIYMFVDEFLFGSPIPVQVSGRRDGRTLGEKLGGFLLHMKDPWKQ